jgi:metal-responsive CopG/Arc/MetJ family transcriptional regulator
MKVEYVNLKLPKDLVELVRKFIEENPELGYTSVPEFVKEAIRSYIIELEAKKPKWVKVGEVEID